MNTASVFQRQTQKFRFDVCTALFLHFSGWFGSVAAWPAGLDTVEVRESVNKADNTLFVIKWEGSRNSFLRHWIVASKPNPPLSFVSLSCCRFISRQIGVMNSNLLGG